MSGWKVFFKNYFLGGSYSLTSPLGPALEILAKLVNCLKVKTCSLFHTTTAGLVHNVNIAYCKATSIALWTCLSLSTNAVSVECRKTRGTGNYSEKSQVT